MHTMPKALLTAVAQTVVAVAVTTYVLWVIEKNYSVLCSYVLQYQLWKK